MKLNCVFVTLLFWANQTTFGQHVNTLQNVVAKPIADSTSKPIFDIGNVSPNDTVPNVNFPDVNIITFKTTEEWMEYYRCRARILKVLPYVRIAKQLYVELHTKEDTATRREYRHYRKDLEKEMRAKFENE